MDIRNGRQGLLHVARVTPSGCSDATGTRAVASGERHRREPRRSPVGRLRRRDRAVRVAGHGGVAERRPRLHHLLLPARRHPSGRRGRDAVGDQADIRRDAGIPRFLALPDVRASGDWPGKSSYTKLTKFFYIITVLALLAALVLIANTITTLVVRADVGDRDHESGRRPPPPDRRRLPEDGAAARRARNAWPGS